VALPLIVKVAGVVIREGMPVPRSWLMPLALVQVQIVNFTEVVDSNWLREMCCSVAGILWS
jgi:hypothetical protein